MDDWESRRPCPDGACTGILDREGICGTCGTRGAPPGNGAGEASQVEADREEPLSDEEDGGDGWEESDDEPSSEDEDWDRRTLCPDGSCTGVLGPDGVCGTCGRKA